MKKEDTNVNQVAENTKKEHNPAPAAKSEAAKTVTPEAKSVAPSKSASAAKADTTAPKAVKEENKKADSTADKKVADAPKASDTKNTAEAKKAPESPKSAEKKQPEFKLNEIQQSLENVKRRSKISNLLVAALIVVCGGYICYLQSTSTDTLKAVRAEADNYVQDLKVAAERIDANKTIIESQIRDMQKLLDSNLALKAQNDELVASLEAIKSQVGNETDLLDKVNTRLDRYEARNPDDWRLAQSYFLVSAAYRMAVFARDLKSALWCLESADKLLVDIEDESVIQIRKALSDDIMAVSNIPQLDLRGLVNKIDSVYGNLEKMTLLEISTPEQRAESFKKAETAADASFADTVTDTLVKWKDNFVASFKDFSSRFVEIRRRDEQAVNLFLSADQAKLLLENLKSQLLLAKMAVYEQDETAFNNSIEQTMTLIKGYYNPDTPAYKANIEALESLKNSKIATAKPEGLQSYNLFDKYARQILRFNTPDVASAE